MEKLKTLLRRFSLLRSLKTRIFLMALLLGVIPSLIIEHVIVDNYETRAIEVRKSEVQSQMQVLANHLINYNYLQDTSSEVVNAELEQISGLYDGRVMIIDRSFRIIKDTYGISEGKYMISEEVMRCFQGTGMSNYDRVNGYIETTTPIVMTQVSEPGEDGTVQEDMTVGVMLTSASTDYVAATQDVLSRKAMLIEVIMLFVIMGMAAVLSWLLVRPFGRITQAISEVKAGFTDEQISVPDYLETEHIVDAFNQLLGRMKVLDDSRQEFVSNVSHELKTPITSMKVLADSLLQQPDAPVELYQEFMEDIADEIDRENKIITDLLSLVKMDKKAAQLDVTSVNINELLELILKRLRPIARKQDIEVVFESLRPVTAEIDEVKFTLAISNLVENAIKYNKPHGWVKVLLDADYQFFTVEVSDSGIGIPQEELEHIFERFYRVDKSHSREIGGTGLGLAIARNAILMHRGSVRAESILDEGTTFTVRMPLIHIA